MPIKGLTDQKEAFPRIGKLRKGDKKRSPKTPGKDLTYFRFTSDYPEVERAFYGAYPAEPRDINFFFPHERLEENWDACKEEWKASTLVHRCDGETCSQWLTPDGKMSREPKPCPGGCVPVGRLTILIPELKRLASVTVETHSWNDIKALDQQMKALQSLRKDFRGIPFVLHRRPRKVSTPKTYPKGHPKQYQPTGERVRREKWLLTVEAAPDWFALQLAAQQAAAIPQLTSANEIPELEMPLDENDYIVNGETGEVMDAAGPDWNSVPNQDEPPPESKLQSPPSGNGNGVEKLPRPLTPTQVRDGIRKRAGWQGDRRLVDGEPITDAQKTGFVRLLADALGNMDGPMKNKSRHQLLSYLVGIDSTNHLTKKEASALISWLKVEGDEWVIHPQAATEASQILEAVAVGQGQMKMDLDAPPPPIEEESELDGYFPREEAE